MINTVKFYGVDSESAAMIENILTDAGIAYDCEGRYRKDSIDLEVTFATTQDKLKGINALRHRY